MCDFRSLFFEKQQEAVQQQSASSRGPKQAPDLPVVVDLIHNFRTHSQILALSNICVDVLEALFPTSIDRMRRDEVCI
jgi:hypothetical protein